LELLNARIAELQDTADTSVKQQRDLAEKFEEFSNKFRAEGSAQQNPTNLSKRGKRISGMSTDAPLPPRQNKFGVRGIALLHF
jgi:hypothetical protein